MFPVSAVTYDPCDVNRDGAVGLTDLILVKKYLSGIFSTTNYNQLDVNGSLTVDAADDECLSAINLGMTYNCGYFSRATGATVSPPTVSGFTPSNSSSSSAGRTYMRRHYENGQPAQSLSNYTLTPELQTLNTGVNSRIVIGDDERYTSYSPENNGIVYISMDGFYMASGFIVGDHQIATAAHCVYKNGSWRSLILKTYDSNGCLTNNTLNVVEAHIPTGYIAGSDIMYDYALITVSDDLSDYVHFSLGTPYNVNAAAYSNIPIYVTGSPADKLKPTVPERLFSAQGSVMNKNSSLSNHTDVICYDVDTAGGDSGAPVYTITKIDDTYVYTAIAVHSSGISSLGKNIGSMITNYHLQFYNNNPNINY